ncbi:MAG: C1 family peptidase [Prosthecobacter sp.]
MVYQLARIYDEWGGEDYEGSSCRGAMKGWHRHGVCLRSLWDDKSGKPLTPDPGWSKDAISLPIGAYFRIETRSLTDIQSAITEAGAVYVSAEVHDGWDLPETDSLVKIPRKNKAGKNHKMIGGHAFAIVGYQQEGFIVQNSWGSKWGYGGFAILQYDDWLEHASDAWVATLGAPLSPAFVSPIHMSGISLEQRAMKPSSFSFFGLGAPSKSAIPNTPAPWNEGKSYQHSLVFGNNGHLKRNLVEALDAEQELKKISEELPLVWMEKAKANRKIVIYAHGGLNSETDALKRVARMGPYFLDNDVYPLFYVWKSGLEETLGNILLEFAGDILGRPLEGPASGFMAELREKAKRFANALSEVSDTAFEKACQALRARGLWSEMKENAALATRPGRGLTLLVQSLIVLKKAYPDVEVHLIGHSAGCIVHGHLVELMRQESLTVASCHLYAPACTVPFALEKYKPALGNKLAFADFYCHLMSDEREKDDNVASLYRKSLLYLVSRALEVEHKMPLLGMENIWNAGLDAGNPISSDRLPEVKKWRNLMSDWQQTANYQVHKMKQVSNSTKTKEDLGHGSFDNDINIIGSTLKIIRGKDLKKPIIDLRF